ncbi:hypothetical protein EOD41_03965 [Mucilaginibacter limnophilus]|uniref:Uncharacterized protein n=1 Tax=Mucilaginibacter limnophilus TaxID=1932778 RepID=A0A437MZL8_9SPHI|nr:hypothetical protein [Mucilaginibacter limnophilus]RVU03098.1 hypothetical protein EOD41_03965 [Mucilaginibacter limnophilus]
MQPDKNFTTPSPAVFKSILIIHFALLVGQLLFAAVTFNLQAGKTHFEINTGDILTFIVPVFAVVGFLLCNMLGKRQLENIQTDATPTQKLAKYQTAMIIKSALLEGPSLFGIAVFFITGNLFFLMISGALMVYFLLITPTKERVFNDAKFNYDESF